MARTFWHFFSHPVEEWGWFWDPLTVDETVSTLISRCFSLCSTAVSQLLFLLRRVRKTHMDCSHPGCRQLTCCVSGIDHVLPQLIRLIRCNHSDESHCPRQLIHDLHRHIYTLCQGCCYFGNWSLTTVPSPALGNWGGFTSGLSGWIWA